MLRNQKQRVYCDYAATTPVDPRVIRAMEPYFGAKFGNASSLHSFGQEAIAAVDGARETVAKAIHANFREVIFTGSATEANNLALRGALNGIMNHESRIKGGGEKRGAVIHNSNFIIPRIIVSAIEHESVLETARDLERDGVDVVIVPVDRRGVVDLKKLKAALNERTVLVSAMYANNEIGTVEPVSEIARIVSDFREELRIRNQESGKNKTALIHDSNFVLPLLHADAVQAFQFLDCDVDRLGVDFMTLSGHKLYGPKGVGALYVRGARAKHESGIRNQGTDPTIIPNSRFIIHPLLTGGGQEFGLRSGTENVPAIVGFARAIELAVAVRAATAHRLDGFSHRFWNGLRKICPHAILHGVPLEKAVSRGRLPNVMNVCLDRNAQEFLMALDLAGVAASAGSACAARSPVPSHVLRAIGCSREEQRASVRFSFGRPTSARDIDIALRVIGKL